MGYSTTFEGKIAIKPELTVKQMAAVQDFCDNPTGPGCPSIHCDWWLNGESNGSEKSYEMPAWLELLIKKFFDPWGCRLDGVLVANGQRPLDVWKLVVEDNKVSTRKLPVPGDW